MYIYRFNILRSIETSVVVVDDPPDTRLSHNFMVTTRRFLGSEPRLSVGRFRRSQGPIRRSKTPDKKHGAPWFTTARQDGARATRKGIT